MTPILAATASERAELITFIILAPVSVVSALGVVLSRNAVYSALLLVVNLFCLAGFYVLLEAQFVAAVQVIVYAGAIMVLFLFVVMLLNLDQAVEVERHAGPSLSGRSRFVAGAAAALLGLVVLASAQVATLFTPTSVPPGQLDGFERIATLLFSRYALPFEAASLLLLATMVAVIVLAKRQRGPATRVSASTEPAEALAPAGSGGAAR
ncbi:MAG: NADH-quinone oxidoreductase subunit J [Actinomycetes bacterium]